MTLVTFNSDVSPYMTGDTVELSASERRRVDEEAARRKLKDAYTSHEAKPLKKKEAKKEPTKRRAKASK